MKFLLRYFCLFTFKKYLSVLLLSVLFIASGAFAQEKDLLTDQVSEESLQADAPELCSISALTKLKTGLSKARIEEISDPLRKKLVNAITDKSYDMIGRNRV